MSTAIDAITIPTREELVSRARALQPLLREHAATGDTERKASDAVIDAVTAAGFFRLLSPRQFGGYEADVRTVLEISELLGQADGSVAWLVGLGATATWLAAHFPDRARSEVFADNGDARIAGAATPGPARRVEGGLRVSGRWAYASGSPHATWAGVIAMLTDESGAARRRILVPDTGVRPAVGRYLADNGYARHRQQHLGRRGRLRARLPNHSHGRGLQGGAPSAIGLTDVPPAVSDLGHTRPARPHPRDRQARR